MAPHPLDTDEPPSWDVLTDSETDLLVELDDLRAEIATQQDPADFGTREDRVRVVRELLAAVRDSITRRAAATALGGLP